MSEQRFTFIADYDWWFVCDGEKKLNSEQVVGLLNEQQATIETLKKLNNSYAEKFAKIVNEIMEDVEIDDE